MTPVTMGETPFSEIDVVPSYVLLPWPWRSKVRSLGVMLAVVEAFANGQR